MSGTWWRDGVLYHVYLRSFADSDGDGVGDIPGLISRLDHLEWLGIDGVWVSPVMPSPNDDWGYDVSDYCTVDPEYGTLEDVDRLVAEASKRGIKVVFDLVPNHSSDRHAWFVESRSSRDSAKRDWYIWADPAPDGGPPNNWAGNFFGPAWELDEATGQYFLHSFLESQADLNWWNEEVRAAFRDILRFWFDRGIAGFRIDVVHKLVKDRGLGDNPPATADDSFIEQAWGQKELLNANLPETHEILRGWRRVADEYDPPAMLLGETYVLDIPRMVSYYGNGDELDLCFNIPFLYAPFDAETLRAIVEEVEATLPPGAWPIWNGGSHDISRWPTRWCDNDERKIRCALMMLLTLRGTPLLYYGDEIGMGDGEVPVEQSLDPLGSRVPGLVTAGRDPARTPMRWSGGPGAGFTTEGAKPWLPLGAAASVNVEAQRDDPGSILGLCRDLIALRRVRPDLQSGDYRSIEAAPGAWAWRRGNRTAVALNLSDDDVTLDELDLTVLVGTDRRRRGKEPRGLLALGAWEGVVYEYE
ncbi:MAG TPA: alpha-amylase family glycosyl hydrolase [Actinomycetota bacterium]|nr:alpha-amylase family glycosyl hydrolase [Actinomycetota bacterium]